jgi:hypothetical protein
MFSRISNLANTARSALLTHSVQIFKDYIADAKDPHLRISREQEQTLADNFVNNITDPGFANIPEKGI